MGTLRTLILLISALILVVSAPSGAQEPPASEDSVFLDEGDGDFESVPIPPPGTKQPARDKVTPEAAASSSGNAKPEPVANAAPKKAKKESQKKDTPEPKPAKKANKPAGKREAKVEAQAESVFDLPTANPVAQQEEATAAAAAAPVEAPPEAPAMAQPAPETAAAPAKPSAKKKASAGGKKQRLAKGLYVVSKGKCPMTREPAAESAVMLEVKPAKKLWAEEVDENWLRAFNKAGEPGYLKRDCFDF